MAIVNVNGTITRTFFDGKGAEVTESWKSNGETMSKRWAAFFDQPHGLSEGDVVEVSGMHGDKIDEWEKDGESRRTVKRTLNKAKVKGSAAAPVTAPVDEPWSASTPGADVWNTPTTDSEIPF